MRACVVRGRPVHSHNLLQAESLPGAVNGDVNIEVKDRPKLSLYGMGSSCMDGWGGFKTPRGVEPLTCHVGPVTVDFGKLFGVFSVGLQG